jgi:hypothetical protein
LGQGNDDDDNDDDDLASASKTLFLACKIANTPLVR